MRVGVKYGHNRGGALTASLSTPSAIVLMMLSTTFLWFPLGLSLRNRIIRHPSSSGLQCTSTMRSSNCSPDDFRLANSKDTRFSNAS